LAAILAGCLVVAPRRRGRPRALALAVAAGVIYGVTAGLIKVALQTLDHGVAAMLTSWPIYAHCHSIASLPSAGFCSRR
jgi:hypothetical protein